MKANDYCIKIITVMGTECACLYRVKSVRRGVIRLQGDDMLKYSTETYREIDPVIHGCFSRLVEIDGGSKEIHNWKEMIT